MKVYHPALNDDVYSMFMEAFNKKEPTLFVEDSKLYKKMVSR